MSDKKKLIHIGRVVIGNKIIKKIGLDTDICLNWINGVYSDHQPNIINKNNKLFISYKVFGEIIGNLIGDKNANQKMLDDIRTKIFKFMKEKRISLIKKSYINQNEVNNLFFDLKDQNFKETPGNSDLRIISIYKIAGMNCIFSNNKKHFEEPCDYVKIHFERPFMIKKGSMQEVNRMLRDLYSGNKRFKRKK